VLVAVVTLAGAVVAHHDLSPDVPFMSAGMVCLAVLSTGLAVATAARPRRQAAEIPFSVPAPAESMQGPRAGACCARDGPLFLVLGVVLR
jgi:hypothetical protein